MDASAFNSLPDERGCLWAVIAGVVVFVAVGVFVGWLIWGK